jgi:hypothetical protein
MILHEGKRAYELIWYDDGSVAKIIFPQFGIIILTFVYYFYHDEID